MISDYRDENHANIEDIEYIFGDIDNYARPYKLVHFLIKA